MPGFYYWFPEPVQTLVDERAGKLKVGEFERYECGYLFADRDVVPDQVACLKTDGPGGNLGTLVYPKPVDKKVEIPRCIYDPESQDWVRFKGYWIGMDRGNMPKVAHLRRSRLLVGYDVEDSSGELWKVPIIRRSVGVADILPKVSEFDENGNFVTRRHSSTDHLWELAGKAFDILSLKREYTDEELNRMIVEFLAANYYIGVAEVFAFAKFGKLFLETVFVAEVLASVTDYQLIGELQEEKKSTQPA
ncbi:MAG: hypothetical protein E6Q97_37100 [Desulfurellales bacterium]|nr:MAG: hypothetical protein E6Q97_37100 [Desulfurellales bacterium]